MFSSDVSQSTNTSPLGISPCALVGRNRSALIFIWWELSSPLTYRMLRSGMLRMVCRVSVDFPMPGSPPKRMMLPGTMPPPNTRLSSSSWVSMRGSASCEMSWSFTGWLRRGSLTPPALPCLTDRAACLATAVP